MEDIERTLTFGDRFYAFFVTDDNVRWKTIAFAITSATAFAAIDILFGNPSLDDLVTFLTFWVVICYVVAVAHGTPCCGFESLSGHVVYRFLNQRTNRHYRRRSDGSRLVSKKTLSRGSEWPNPAKLLEMQEI
jgi:hypothetical protein